MPPAQPYDTRTRRSFLPAVADGCLCCRLFLPYTARSAFCGYVFSFARIYGIALRCAFWFTAHFGSRIRTVAILYTALDSGSHLPGSLPLQDMPYTPHTHCRLNTMPGWIADAVRGYTALQVPPRFFTCLHVPRLYTVRPFFLPATRHGSLPTTLPHHTLRSVAARCPYSTLHAATAPLPLPTPTTPVHLPSSGCVALVVCLHTPHHTVTHCHLHTFTHTRTWCRLLPCTFTWHTTHRVVTTFALRWVHANNVHLGSRVRLYRFTLDSAFTLPLPLAYHLPHLHTQRRLPAVLHWLPRVTLPWIARTHTTPLPGPAIYCSVTAQLALRTAHLRFTVVHTFGSRWVRGYGSLCLVGCLCGSLPHTRRAAGFWTLYTYGSHLHTFLQRVHFILPQCRLHLPIRFIPRAEHYTRCLHLVRYRRCAFTLRIRARGSTRICGYGTVRRLHATQLPYTGVVAGSAYCYCTYAVGLPPPRVTTDAATHSHYTPAYLRTTITVHVAAATGHRTRIATLLRYHATIPAAAQHTTYLCAATVLCLVTLLRATPTRLRTVQRVATPPAKHHARLYGFSIPKTPLRYTLLRF